MVDPTSNGLINGDHLQNRLDNGQGTPGSPSEDGETKSAFRRPLMETKNIPCVFFARGECKHGSTCRFSHDFDPATISKTEVSQQQIDAQQQDREPGQFEPKEQNRISPDQMEPQFSPSYDGSSYEGMDMYAAPFGPGRMMPVAQGQTNANMNSGMGQPGKNGNALYPQMYSMNNPSDMGHMGMRGDGIAPFGVPANSYMYGYPDMSMMPGMQHSGNYMDNMNEGIKDRPDGKHFNMMHTNGHAVDPRFFSGTNGNGYGAMNGFNYPMRTSRPTYSQNGYGGNMQYGRQPSQTSMASSYGHTNGFGHSNEHISGMYPNASKHTARSHRNDLPLDVCVFYMQGASKCRNGANCGFIHPVPMTSGDLISKSSTDGTDDAKISGAEPSQDQSGSETSDIKKALNTNEKADGIIGINGDEEGPEVVLNGVPCIDVRGRGTWKKYSRSSNHGNHHGGSMSNGSGRGYNANGGYRRGWQYGQGHFEKGRNGHDESPYEGPRFDHGDLPANPTQRRDDGSNPPVNGIKPSHHGPNGKRHSTGGSGTNLLTGRKRMPSIQSNAPHPVSHVPAKPFNTNSEVDFPALPRKGPMTSPDHTSETGPDSNERLSNTTTAAQIAAAAAQLPQPHFRPSMPNGDKSAVRDVPSQPVEQPENMSVEIQNLSLKDTHNSEQRSPFQGDHSSEQGKGHDAPIETTNTIGAAVSA